MNKKDLLVPHYQNELNCYEYFIDYPEKIAESYMKRFHLNKLKSISSFKNLKRSHKKKL